MQRTRKFRWPGILLVLLLAVEALAAGAGAAAPPLTPAGIQDLGELYTDALGRLQAVGIATLEGNWAAQPMTRGDLAVLGTEAFCRQEEAYDRQGEAAYSDTAQRSVSGSVAVAKDLGLLDAYPGDKLFPDHPVTYGEVGAFLARILGLGPEGGIWPDEYLQAAAESELLLPDPPVANYTDDTAVRGWSLYMADYAFQVPVDIGGSTRYQLLDADPPTLDVFPFDEPVPEPSVLLSGQVTGAPYVWATGDSGEPQYGTITPEGQFEIPVNLETGPNTFAVQAADLCGNTSEPVEVIVELGRAADVRVTASMMVEGESATEAIAGATVEFWVRAEDFDGNPFSEPQHLYMSVPDGVVDLNADDVGDPGAAVSGWVNNGEGSWQWTPVGGEPGTYAVSLRLVKAGFHLFQFTFESPDHFGNTGLFRRVRPDTGTTPFGMQFRVGTGAFGEEVAVTAGRAARVEARLTDRFGNAVSLPVSYTVQIQCSAGDCGMISMRNSADGPEITQLEIQSTATFYLVAGAEGAYQVTFTSIDPGTGDPTGDVSATLTVDAGP